MSLQPGSQFNRYQILSKLGAGGMGEVFLAEDTSLRRKIAIKILPANSIVDDRAKLRLVREAQSAAALDHPNICAIYEVGESDGHTFICMEIRRVNKGIVFRGLSLLRRVTWSNNNTG